MTRTSSFKPEYFFFLFIAIYFILWGLIPGLSLQSIPPDTAENFALSHALSWSYSKHPPLGMFVLRIMMNIFHHIEFTAYLAGSLCLIVSLIYIYKTSLLYFSKTNAIAMTMLSSLSYYFLVNFVLQYNQNTIMMPFWMASIYYFLVAIDKNRCIHWLLLAAVCALGMLAKYEMLLIIGLECIYLLIHYKKTYTKNILCALLLFLVMLAPHVYWLWQHHFYPLQFILHESSSRSKSQLVIFLGAAVIQPTNLILAFLVILSLYRFKVIVKNKEHKTVKLTHPLVFFAFTPWMLFSLISLLMHTKSEWGYPILALWIPGLFLLRQWDCQSLKTTTISIIIIQIIIFSSFFWMTFSSKKTKWTNWPSYELAQAATDFWQSNHPNNEPLKYVAGKEFLSFYLAAYLPKDTLFLKNTDFKRSSWIDKNDFYQRGGVFIDQGCTHRSAYYTDLGFKVKLRQCTALHQSSKFKPNLFWVTFYLIGEKSPAAQ